MGTASDETSRSRGIETDSECDMCIARKVNLHYSRTSVCNDSKESLPENGTSIMRGRNRIRRWPWLIRTFI